MTFSLEPKHERRQLNREDTKRDCIAWTDEAIYNVVFCESRVTVNLKSGYTNTLFSGATQSIYMRHF